MNAGTFREDLFFRIAVLEITVPPLRERSSDIPALVHQRLNVEQQLAGRNAPYQIAEHALKALALYEWPGNIRELQNIVSRLVATNRWRRTNHTQRHPVHIASTRPIASTSNRL